MTRISHSGKETYLQCGEKWRLHYQEKLRSPVLSSPLFLGGSFDEALNVLLLSKKPVEKMTEEEVEMSKLDPYEVLDVELTYREHNREKIYVPEYQFAKYFSKDFNPELLNYEDLLRINSTASELGFESFTLNSIEEFVKTCRNEIKTKKSLEKDSQVVYNLINWCSCRRKLRYLLKCYEQEVLPQLKEVISVQRKVELEDGDHTLIGYIDFEAIFTDEPDEVYVIDNKLASKAYPSDAIDDAVQLATYCEYVGRKKAAFIITEKGLRKRDPKYRIQILRGEISEELFEKTFDQFGEVVYAIEQEEFEKTGMDGTKSECFFFGQRCSYYNTCRGEPEKDFLVKLED